MDKKELTKRLDSMRTEAFLAINPITDGDDGAS